MPQLLAFTIPGLDWLSEAFAHALYWLANLCGGNYGLAIILLTFLMRVVILPLSIKQTKSMIAMQKLQPQLKEIQKKYKDDREKMGQEMMKLYKENKVSPLGGCLPLLLQLPIIFAVFDVLNSLSDPVKSNFVSIIGKNPNLDFLGINISFTGQKIWAAGDYVQLILLVLLTVVTGYVSAKMMTVDPKQSKMMAMMPILMGVFAWILPAGVTIYIIATNIFTMVQQYMQLEHDGFYDEKLADIRKMGNEAKFNKKMYLKFMDKGTKAMVALRLREKPKPKTKKKVSTSKAGAKTKGATAGKNSQGKATAPVKKEASTTRGKSKKSIAKDTQAKKASSTKATSKKVKAKDYPAKKKTAKK